MLPLSTLVSASISVEFNSEVVSPSISRSVSRLESARSVSVSKLAASTSIISPVKLADLSGRSLKFKSELKSKSLFCSSASTSISAALVAPSSRLKNPEAALPNAAPPTSVAPSTIPVPRSTLLSTFKLLVTDISRPSSGRTKSPRNSSPSASASRSSGLNSLFKFLVDMSASESAVNPPRLASKSNSAFASGLSTTESLFKLRSKSEATPPIPAALFKPLPNSERSRSISSFCNSLSVSSTCNLVS